MTSAQWFVAVVIITPIGLATLNRLRIDVAALLIATVLGAAQFFGMGVLGPAHTPDNATKALSGLGCPEVAVLLGLFVILRNLERTGAALWLAQRLLRLGGRSERRLISLFSIAAALLSLFMNNVAVGALLLPSAMDTARRTGIKPSKLLMPVAFATALGGAATYFTTANIIVSGLLAVADPPQKTLGILDFTPAGGLMALAGIAYLILFAVRLLPERATLDEQLIKRYTTGELRDVYQLGTRMWEARVQPGSPLVGKTLMEAGIGQRFGLTVLAIWHQRHAILVPSPAQRIAPDDILLIVGREDRVALLHEEGLNTGRSAENGQISARGVALIEAVLAPHSQDEGRTFKEIEFRKKYGFTVVALWRDGRSYRTDVGDFKLRLGDSYLMVGPRDRLRSLQSSADFIVLEPDTSDQPLPVRQVLLASGILGAAIVASAVGFPIYLAMLGGAVLAVAAGLLPMEEAYRAIQWQVIFLIAGMYSASLALIQTGLVESIGHRMVDLTASLGPLGLAAGCFWLTALLTQAMGSQITALVAGPIAISAAIHLHTNPQAIAVATAIGCSASFLTPLAHPVNTLMVGPANYRFADFFRLGWGLMIVCFVALLAGLKLFWGL